MKEITNFSQALHSCETYTEESALRLAALKACLDIFVGIERGSAMWVHKIDDQTLLSVIEDIRAMRASLLKIVNEAKTEKKIRALP